MAVHLCPLPSRSTGLDSHCLLAVAPASLLARSTHTPTNTYVASSFLLILKMLIHFQALEPNSLHRHVGSLINRGWVGFLTCLCHDLFQGMGLA